MSIEAREKAKAKLRALLARTTDHGCTEAEAAIAAEKASALMREHDLAYDDIEEVKSERYGARKRDMNCSIKRRSLHEVMWVTHAIAELFNCKTWTDEENRHRVFFGSEHDTEAAHNLCDMLAATMEFEFVSYLHDPDRDNWDMHGRSIRPSFMQGMTSRLRERINAITAARIKADKDQAQNTGMSTALVTITKRQVVAAKLNDHIKATGMQIETVVERKNYKSQHALRSGKSAADRADLGGSKLAGNRKLIGGR